MSRRIIALLLALACVLAGATTSLGATPQRDAATQALDYIQTLQNADGGFPENGSDSSAGGTLDAMLAFAAAGVDAGGVVKGGHSPLDYLATQAGAYAASADHAAKLVIVLKAVSQDPHDFAGADYVAKMESFYDGSTHVYGAQVIDQALYLLARKSLGLAPPSGAVGVLESKQQAGGCWEYSDGFGCDTNSTAMVVQALLAAGVSKSNGAVQAAIAYFKASQSGDGGFPYVAPGDSDADSTAFVLQALVAAGENVDAGGPWEKADLGPMQALLAFRDTATGAFMYGGADNAYATYQAVPALLLQPLLLPPKAATARPTHTPVATKTRTPEATSTAAPTVASTPSPGPTAVSAVLPAAVAPPATVAPADAPKALASAGQGSDAESPAGAMALLFVGIACVGSAAAMGFVRRR
ncbi:MAG: prenyltransferase/squalene oxidase repeat-containing protein [Dehalococcoidia bacterium]